MASFVDVLSGKRDDRKEYQRMVEFVMAGGADVIVVQFLDRFGRNPREILQRYWQLQDFKVSVIATDEDIQASESIVTLGKSWSQIDDAAQFSVRLVNTLHLSHSNEAQEVVDYWIPRILSDLPELCTDWLSNNFLRMLSEEQRSLVLSQIEAVYQRDEFTDEEATHYHRLIQQMPQEVLKSSEMQSHINELFDYIPTRHTDPNSYLSKFYPTVVGLLRYAEDSVVGKMLTDLFSNAGNSPAVYGRL